MNIISCLILACLTVGHVDRIYENIAVIEYRQSGIIRHIDIPLSDPKEAYCTPKEGQRVYFNEKEIIFCLER
jgi:hypothetical protein